MAVVSCLFILFAKTEEVPYPSDGVAFSPFLRLFSLILDSLVCGWMIGSFCLQVLTCSLIFNVLLVVDCVGFLILSLSLLIFFIFPCYICCICCLCS